MQHQQEEQQKTLNRSQLAKLIGKNQSTVSRLVQQKKFRKVPKPWVWCESSKRFVFSIADSEEAQNVEEVIFPTLC